jgi:hypothetical protein
VCEFVRVQRALYSVQQPVKADQLALCCDQAIMHRSGPRLQGPTVTWGELVQTSDTTNVSVERRYRMLP